MRPPGERANNARSISLPSLRQHYFVAMAWQRLFPSRKIRSRFMICTKSALIRCKDCENRSSRSGDIRQNTAVFWPCRTRRSQMSCQLWNYWTELHEIFTRYTGVICAVKGHTEIAITHSVSERWRATVWSLLFFTKSVAMATSLEISKKEIEIDHLHSKRFHLL